MVRLNKIYTRTGDGGESGLVDGSRLSKADGRFDAIGDVDEANSLIGLALLAVTDPPIRRLLGRLQNELFDLGADLATPGENFEPSEMLLRIVPEQIDRLEREIDEVNESLEPLRSFILPAVAEGRRRFMSRARSSGVPSAPRSAPRATSPSIRSLWPISTACPTCSSWSPACSLMTKVERHCGSRGRLAASTRLSSNEEPADLSGHAALAHRYRAVRALSVDLASQLSDADATLQPMPDASPMKWHLAHGSWFFETFVLRDHLPSYRLHDERWAYLFNSYMKAKARVIARPARMLSRPTLDEILAWRAAVDQSLVDHIDALPPGLIELGLNHEQQHSELALMDMLATFSKISLSGRLARGACRQFAPARRRGRADGNGLADRSDGINEGRP